MKKVFALQGLMLSLALGLFLFFAPSPAKLYAAQQGQGIPVYVTGVTDAFGTLISPAGNNGVYLDGLVITSTSPGANGTQFTLNFYDYGSVPASTPAFANLKFSQVLNTTATSQTITLPTGGIWFKNGIDYVNYNTTSVTATMIYSTR